MEYRYRKTIKDSEKWMRYSYGTRRVIDMAKRGHLKLEQISIFCLDEADRMLDMGFFPDILWIIEKMLTVIRTYYSARHFG